MNYTAMRHVHLVCFLLVLFSTVSYTKPALACGCRTASLSEAYAASDVVFTARITQRTNPSGERILNELFAFEDVELYKGSIQFSELSTSSGSCGVHFKPGVEYLIFASSSGLAGACGGTRAVGSKDGVIHKGVTWLNTLKSFKAGDANLVSGWTVTAKSNTCLLSGEISPGGKLVLGYVPEAPNRDEIYELRFNTPESEAPRHAKDLKPLRNVNLGFGQSSIGLRGSSSGGLVRSRLSKSEFYQIIDELKKLTSSEKAIATITAGLEKKQVSLSRYDEDARKAFHEFSGCMRQFE